jgi:hypothetical protein
VEVETSPGEELMKHMKQTVMGQPGGIRYHHTDLEEKMKLGDENYFMYLRKSGRMLGSVGLCSKPTATAGIDHDSWLVRYFSIDAPIKGIPEKRKTRAQLQDENKRTTVLGRFIQPIFADPSRLRQGESSSDHPAIIFAIIDQTNLRSMNFSAQMGLETVGTMAVLTFSRVRPRRSNRIETVEENERKIVLDQIRDYYKNYTLFYSDSIFNNNNYFVIKEEGRMVAGLQIYEVCWKMVDFGNTLANKVSILLSRIPRLNKRVDKDEITFLAFDAIYCEPGYEKVLYELMEGVLERTKHILAMLMMDRESDLYRLFMDQKKLGMLNKVVGTAYGDIRVRFIHMPETVRQAFHDRPTYIPTYDNT